jgi:hypothetical protein
MERRRARTRKVSTRKVKGKDIAAGAGAATKAAGKAKGNRTARPSRMAPR